MGCEKVEMILKLPEPMVRWEAKDWESINRPKDMLWLKEFEPVGVEPTDEWRAVYETCDEVTTGLCS
jgi:hypothetical protein